MREIEPKMVDFLDKKLATHGAAQDAIKRKDARALFVYAAEACVGIREKGGNNRGPMVELIQETIGSADREAWCMAFVQTCLAYAEVKTEKVSPIFASEHCVTTWNKTPKSQRVKKFPARGAIAIGKYGTTSNGHTMIVLATAGEGIDEMECSEGNTESGLVGGKVERDGGGVYLTKRSMKGSGNFKILGFLKPF